MILFFQSTGRVSHQAGRRKEQSFQASQREEGQKAREHEKGPGRRCHQRQSEKSIEKHEIEVNSVKTVTFVIKIYSFYFMQREMEDYNWSYFEMHEKREVCWNHFLPDGRMIHLFAPFSELLVS